MIQVSVKDYDQRLVQLWLDASRTKGGIHLDFTDTTRPDGGLGAAVTQRHKMYRLRKEMQREHHEFAAHASKCKISTRVLLKSGEIILFSRLRHWTLDQIKKIELHIISNDEDSVLDKALKTAGYDTPKAPSFD
jgi:hypothetical protein